MLECSRRDVATSMLQVEKSASKSLLGLLATKKKLNPSSVSRGTETENTTTWC